MTDIAEEYRSSLSELNFNSKPHINMLTMLAEENAAHAAVIVQTIVDHINSVTPDVKLPSLYLVDSIVKNIGKVYIPLFSKHLISLFTSVFEKVDENIRSLLYKLRSTWTGLFPNTVLLQLDRSVVCLDPAWPILAKPQIHFNPKFLKETAPVQLPQMEEPSAAPQNALIEEVEMKKRELLLLQTLHQKKKELITLQLKAALASPTVADSVKEDAKKIVNTRDPRLSKKMIATSQPDSAVLQSVVVIPKGNVNKRNEKESIATASKKIKLDSVSSSKKDLKTKSNSMELESSSKLNVELNTRTNLSKPVQVQKGDRNKKQSSNSEISSELNIKLPLQQNVDFTKDTSPSNVNSLPERSNELIKNNFVPKTSVTEENKYLFKSQPVLMTNEDTCHKNIQKSDQPPSSPLFLGNEDKDYRILPKTANKRNLNESSYTKRPDVPVVKSFILDKKERKVYFVHDRSFAFMDDNVPKELTFEGPPKLVFIEGLPHPIELSFGQEVKFDIDGKCNFIKFGTPSREIYINDYPFEAQFGGPSFTAMLSDGKIHRINISGPPPHVVLSQSPSYELYEKFCQYNKEFLRRFDNEPSISNDNLSSDIHVGTRDVDMRMNNVKLSSTFFNFPLERMQDVDWQRIHVDNMQQTEWNVPKNSFESFKDIEPNFTAPRKFSQGPEWENPHPLPEMQFVPINPPPLPPKQMIDKYPLPTNIYRNIDVNNAISMNQFPMKLLPPCNMEQPRFTVSNVEQPRFLPPTNVPFSQPNHISNEFSVNRLDLNLVKNCNIPRLSPPPLPPFIGPIQTTSGMPRDPSSSTSAPFSNSISSSPLLPTPVSAPLLNLPSLQPMARLSAPLPANSFSSTTQVSNFTVPESVPKSTAIPSSTALTVTSSTSDMQLFMEKLKAAGLIKSDLSTSSSPVSTSAVVSEPEKKEEEKTDDPPKEEIIPEITFDSKCLKEYHPGVIAVIYSGSQCATCGMRFKEIQSEQYSRHLDWHFRRNRREKDGAKKPFSRRWFYEIKDWIEFKEFEDKDERAPSYFELQANSEQIEEVPENICSVSCSECDSENCAVCDEQFQLFWVEEEEEWHLRNAVKHDNQVYHPACYEDFKKANEPVPDTEITFDDSMTDIKPNETTTDIKPNESMTDIKPNESMTDIKPNDSATDKPNDSTTDIKPSDSSNDIKSNGSVTDIKPDVKELNIEMKIEVMDVDISIKSEVMDIELELPEEPMDVNDNVVKRDMKPVPDKMPEQVDSVMKNEIEELKVDENLKRIEKEAEVVENNQIKEVKLEVNKIKKEVKLKENKIEKNIKLEENKMEKEAKLKENKMEKEVNIKEVKLDENKIEKERKIKEAKLKENIKEVKLDENKIEKERKIKEAKLKENKMEKEVNIKEVKLDGNKIEKERKIKEVKLENNKSEKEKIEENKTEKEVIIGENKTEETMSQNVLNREKGKSHTESVTLENVEKSIEVKKEPVKVDETKPNSNNNSKTDISSSERNSNVSSTVFSETNEKTQFSSPPETVPPKSEDESEDIEFRPPTPDPRFEVLPPVSRGTEISNLCTIM